MNRIIDYIERICTYLNTSNSRCKIAFKDVDQVSINGTNYLKINDYLIPQNTSGKEIIKLENGKLEKIVDKK